MCSPRLYSQPAFTIVDGLVAEDEADMADSADDVDSIDGMLTPDETDMLDVSGVVDVAVFNVAGVEIAIAGVLWAVLEAIVVRLQCSRRLVTKTPKPLDGYCCTITLFSGGFERLGFHTLEISPPSSTIRTELWSCNNVESLPRSVRVAVVAAAAEVAARQKPQTHTTDKSVDWNNRTSACV